MVYVAADYPEVYRACMDAILQAACQIFAIAMQEGIDFMSEGGYGLEMVSPAWYEKYDLPYIQQLSGWTHAHGGLFWEHNCGRTRQLMLCGFFNRLGVDVLETISPPPEGNNDLAEARRLLDPAICTKGNLSLILLRDGSVEEIRNATRKMVGAVRGFAHIHSTADAVFAETPAENFVAFLRTARAEAEKIQDLIY
jgi:uroporphyrinogen-III decarboxylase